MKIILVYGPRKGGTTLTQRLMDGPDWTVHGGETKIKAFNRLLSLKHSGSPVSDPELDWFFQGAAKGKESRSREWVRLNLNRIETLEDYVLSTVEHYRRFGPKEMGTPEEADDLVFIKEVGGHPRSVIDRFLMMEQGFRVLAVIRDPRFIASAVYRNRRSHGIKLKPLDTLLEARDAFLCVAQIRRLVGGGGSIEIAVYENIIRDPKGFVMEAAERLGLGNTPPPFPTEGGERSVVTTASIPEFADRVFVRDAEWFEGLTMFERACIHAQSLLRWRLLRFYRQVLRSTEIFLP